MQQLESRMAAEKAKIAEYSQSKQDELSHRLQQAVLDVQAAETNLKQSEALVLEKKNEVSALRAEGDQVDREIDIAKRSVLDFREQIQRCVDQQNNSLAPYGRDLQKVLERIGRMKWHGQRPVGPLGVYVKVKDRVWADLLRIVLGSHMGSFAVTDSRDLPILKGLLKESGKFVDRNFLIFPSFGVNIYL
jgi:structural maintenance of chromosomes protein 6